MKTSQCITDPQIISLCSIAEWGLSWSNGQAHFFENLNGRLGPCLRPQTVFACPFSPLYHPAWKEFWGGVIEMLVAMPQTN